MSTFFETVKARSSANNFDKEKPVSEEQIRQLVSYAIEAPSSFNIQHWRFLAVKDLAAKQRLKAVAYGQPKVADAAVTFIILGDMDAYQHVAKAFDPLFKKGIIDQKALDGLTKMLDGMYREHSQNRRDEAIRSASMAAMNLMNAATAMGMISAPMIGFDSAGVKKEFGISEQFVPVMLVAVGHPAPGNWPKKPRFTVEQVLSIDKMKEFRF